MRIKLLSALVVLAALPLAAVAQPAALPRIEQVIRIGLPSGQGESVGRTREGTWMPIYVKIKPGNVKASGFRLVVEAPDAEETAYRNVLTLPTLEPNQDLFAITYLRQTSAEFQIWLEFPDHQVVPKSKSTERANNEALRGGEPLFLALGGFPPAGLKKILTPPPEKPPQPGVPQPGVGIQPIGPGRGGPRPPVVKGNPQPVEKPPANPEPDKGNLEVVDAAGSPQSDANSYAFIGSVQDMPENWYGYDAVDVIVLVTDSAPFLNELKNSKTRRQALVEWVRRGGKLVVSLGGKAVEVADLLDTMALPEGDKGNLLNCEINGNVRRKVLRSLNTWADMDASSRLRDVDVAKLTPGAGARVLLTEPPEEPVHSPALYGACGPGVWNAPVGYDAEPRPLIVDAACGLGRVLLIAIDLDARPFTGWPGQIGVWKQLRKEMAPGLTLIRETSDQGNNGNPNGVVVGGGRGKMGSNGENATPEILREMRSDVETFGGVPTVPFGWVALFIIVYIAIVGPLDYFLLAKVFKRLELTWLTFPAVVLTLSVGAYFGAYALKGDKRRFNKLDVVEIDVGGHQAYGTTWFAIFSPRIENYTVGVEPQFPGKALTPQNNQDGHSAVVTVLEAPQAVNNMRTKSLFGRPYEYAPAAAGMERVPIPVWSIRSFSASWRTPLDPTKPPILATGNDKDDADTLTTDRNGKVKGTIANNLPVTLKDVALFYRGKWYAPPKEGGRDFGFNLAPGASFPVDAWDLKVEGGGEVLQWKTGRDPLNPGREFPNDLSKQETVTDNPYGHIAGRGVGRPLYLLTKEFMFFDRDRQQGLENSGLRYLDQEWRLKKVTDVGLENKPAHFLNEVILVARTEFVPQGDSEKVNEKSLVRLWVGDLPKTGGKRPALVGQTTESTFVRVYIPVRPRR
jgi:hypothetical protein